jgi:endo-1,4-beta-xylanase
MIMRNNYLKSSLVAFFAVVFIACVTTKKQATTLKDAFKGKFYIGAALNTSQIPSDNAKENALITSQFNSIVAENCMKSEKIQPQQGVFTFDDADRFVKFGEDNNMWIIGHTLVWHSQAPKWLFVDAEGNDVSRDTLIARMKTHITTLVGRYKGRVKGWDVVNEAIEDYGEYRQSKFFKIIGEDYIELAFRFAREADPEAELYYNDYSMANPGRREGVVKMVKGLQAKGINVDGIGMQGHLNIDVPDINEFEKSIIAFSELGVKVMVTELDITVLPWPSQKVTAEVSTNFELKAEYNPFPDGLSEEMNEKLNNRFTDFFKLFIKHSDKISRVTLWGVYDSQSWRNNWPIHGRKDYPLLFDRDLQPKPAVARIIEAAIEE